MPNCEPDWPNAAGASVADENVWYGDWTGGLGVTCSGTDSCWTVRPAQLYPTVGVSVLVLSSPDGAVGVTVNVALTVWPLATRANVVAEVARAFQPDGAVRPSR